VVGGLADWFAVTALFRHPLGLPIPHTAIIPTRRAKIIESIVNMVEEEWLSPEVIGQRLARLSPGDAVVDWLRDPAHVERLGAPLRDVLRGLARALTEAEVTGFVDRALQRQLRELPVDATTGRWLARLVESESAASAFTAFATSLANLASRPRTAEELHWWLDRSAHALREGGKRLVPFVLRRKFFQRRFVEAACDYAAAELANAARDPAHPLRRVVLGGVARFAERLAAGDPDALAQADACGARSSRASRRARSCATRSPGYARSSSRTSTTRTAPSPPWSTASCTPGSSSCSRTRAARDVRPLIRATAEDLLRRHHHQIGITVRENLEALETGELVARIEDRVGADLQFIRLNGALVGGLVGSRSPSRAGSRASVQSRSGAPSGTAGGRVAPRPPPVQRTAGRAAVAGRHGRSRMPRRSGGPSRRRTTLVRRRSRRG
jgi:uncharacterized membrane-anchored protein YjiN (DUF445 family)